MPSVQQVAGITRTLTCPIADGARPRVGRVASTADDTRRTAAALLIAAIAVAVGAVVAVLVVAAVRQTPDASGARPHRAVPAPQAASPNARR